MDYISNSQSNSIKNAKEQQRLQIEMERIQRNKKPVGRPRKVGRPKGSTKIKSDE